MKGLSFGRHGQFLFRTYLYLVAGLLLTAVVLDFGFERLQSRIAPDEDPWVARTFELVERHLAAVPEPQREAAARALGVEIGAGIQLLAVDEYVSAQDAPSNIATLVDAEGSVSYLRDAPLLGGLIRLGPLPPLRESVLLKLLPPIFYISIFVVVGLWLRPLLRDLRLIDGAAQRFAADYREPLSIAGETTQLTGLAKNLDEMSARLSGLIRSQKELIVALSHEMRTPLARIRFALAVLGEQQDDKLQKQLEAIGQDVQEIDRLIATMLNYARLDHPDLQMAWEQVPVDAWLRRTIDKCRQPDKEITVATDTAGDEIPVDSRLMALALSNMLVNAAHYGRSRVHCSVRQHGERYRLVVEDDGDGIPETDRDGIFKAFARIDDSRNRETGGYGLGLAIVARIADLHGGTVEVAESPDLGGARFTLSWLAPASVRD